MPPHIFRSPHPLLPQRKPRAVLFDWDLTLADTRKPIEDALQKTVQAHWSPEKGPAPDAATLWGEGSIEAFLTRHFPGQEAPMLDEYIVHYHQTPSEALALLEGARETLAALHARKIPIAIVSNTLETVLEKQVELLGIRHYFDAIVGADPDRPRKPHFDPVLRTLNLLAHRNEGVPLQPENIIFVGDSHIDMQTARPDGIQRICIGDASRLNGHAIHGGDPQGRIIHLPDHAALTALIEHSYPAPGAAIWH
jgi:phosphoglycolate phosphatase-like HAD superfamily hydrolase